MKKMLAGLWVLVSLLLVVTIFFDLYFRENDLYGVDKGISTTSDSIAQEDAPESEASLSDNPEGGDILTDYSCINLLLAIDNTKSMKGYTADKRYGKLLEYLERNPGDYRKKTTVLEPDKKEKNNENEKEYLNWVEYEPDSQGKVAARALNIESGFYCKGTYENSSKGPLSLLLDDTNGVGAFSKDTVTVLVTDFHEQGGSLYSLGGEIKQKCLQNLGEFEKYGAVILGFEFKFSGTSYIIDPYNREKSLSSEMNSDDDRKMLYVVIVGQIDGVKDYTEKLTNSLVDDVNLDWSYCRIDNLEYMDDSEPIIELIPENTATREDFIDSVDENSLLIKAEEYMLGFDTCTPVRGDILTKADLTTADLLFITKPPSVDLSKQNKLFEDFRNCVCSYRIKNTASDLTNYVIKEEAAPPLVFREKKSIFDGPSKWKEIPFSTWNDEVNYFEIKVDNDHLRVTIWGQGKGEHHAKTVLNKANFRIVFEFTCLLERTAESLEWIDQHDWDCYMAEHKNASKAEWHTTTLNLKQFCKDLILFDGSQNLSAYNVEPHTETKELIFLQVSN